MIRSESIAPDRVVEWSDSDDLPILDPYCSDVDCCPSDLCPSCIAAKPCYDCGRPSVVIDEDPLCAPCAAARMEMS